MSLFSSRLENKYFLILEIESALVRASLVQNNSIIFVHELPIAWKPGTASGYLVKTTLHVMRECLEAVLMYIRHPAHKGALPKHISTVHFVMTSPWIVSQAKRMSLAFPKPVAITRDSIIHLLEEEREKYNTQPDTIEIIEEKISDVRLNGYSVSDWTNRETTALEVEYAASVGGKRVIEKIRELAATAVHAKHISFHSSLVLFHAGLAVSHKDTDVCTLVHIHGEMTDVGILRRGAPVFFGSFPMGYQTLVRKVAAGTKSTLNVADSLMSLEEKGQMDAHHGKNAETVLNNMKDGWAGELRKLVQSAADVSLPAKTFLESAIHAEFFADSYKRAHKDAAVEALPDLSQLCLVALSNVMSSAA